MNQIPALLQALAKKSEFNVHYIRDRLPDWQDAHSLGNANKSDIARWEHARLTPILTAQAALIESLASALEYVISCEPTDASGNFCKYNKPQFVRGQETLAQVTARLSALVEGD